MLFTKIGKPPLIFVPGMCCLAGYISFSAILLPNMASVFTKNAISNNKVFSKWVPYFIITVLSYKILTRNMQSSIVLLPSCVQIGYFIETNCFFFTEFHLILRVPLLQRHGFLHSNKNLRYKCTSYTTYRILNDTRE